MRDKKSDTFQTFQFIRDRGYQPTEYKIGNPFAHLFNNHRRELLLIYTENIETLSTVNWEELVLEDEIIKSIWNEEKFLSKQISLNSFEIT